MDRQSGQFLKGLRAVVTGAAQGLGLGIAEHLASEGANVILADLQLQKAQLAAEDLRSRGMVAVAARLDIANSSDVNSFFNAFLEDGNPLDIFVNNAGLGQSVVPIVELTDDEWARVLQVTLTGTFYCCRAAGRVMEKQQHGCIVNIASINGANPAPLVAAYNVAKAGVISLTKTLALELAAYGVRVNAVNPGPVYTEFNQTVMSQRSRSLGLTNEQMLERIRGAIPLGRWGEASDIAAAVGFLCSPSASWITGEILRVSGGLEGVAAAPPKRAPKPS